MSPVGQSLRRNSAPAPTFVRYGPDSDLLLQCTNGQLPYFNRAGNSDYLAASLNIPQQALS
jgi:hypothetical protein